MPGETLYSRIKKAEIITAETVLLFGLILVNEKPKAETSINILAEKDTR
ncbi:MAG: hypothetical protein WCQ47_07950 [bacterium]